MIYSLPPPPPHQCFIFYTQLITSVSSVDHAHFYSGPRPVKTPRPVLQMFLAHHVPNTVLPAFPQVSSESYATPQASVASRRVARGRSLAPRAASLPPRPLYHEVDSTLTTSTDKTSTTTATFTQASEPAPSRARRPIIVYAAPASRTVQDRAMSVPPVVVFRREEKSLKAQVPAPARDDWRSKARARSVPPTLEPAARSVRRSLRYRAADRARAHSVQAAPRLPLPTAELRAHKVPRRFLSRSAIRTGFTSLRGYHGEGEGAGDSERKQGEGRGWIRNSVIRAHVLAPLPTAGLRAHKVPRRFLTRGAIRTGFTSVRGYHGAGPGAGGRKEGDDMAGIRKSITRTRVLASPLARATSARAWGRVVALPPARPKPKSAPPTRESLKGFPKVYVPSKGPKPSNRSKVIFSFLALAVLCSMCCRCTAVT